MSNHYHLLVETRSPTLSKGMKFLNGRYTQDINSRHHRVGHVFQGRFKAILIDSEAYLLELARYIVLNPVRARMVRTAMEWPWSSYRETAGIAADQPLATSSRLLARFSTREKQARGAYRQFIDHGKGQPSPWDSLRNQVFLGSDQFVEDMLSRIDPKQSLADIPRLQQRMPPKPLEYYENQYSDRKIAMALAYLDGHYTLGEVGEHFHVSYATVSRAAKSYEANVKCKA